MHAIFITLFVGYKSCVFSFRFVCVCVCFFYFAFDNRSRSRKRHINIRCVNFWCTLILLLAKIGAFESGLWRERERTLRS